MLRYQNYVFDLYGTLVDIHTDESMPQLWRIMADLYGRYGIDLPPATLQAEFRRMEREEREHLSRTLETSYPEIPIERVFLRLRDELAHSHPCDFVPDDTVWVQVIANTFRALSNRKRRLFPEARETLLALRARGAGVYLLSNAQRIFTMPEIEQLGLVPCFDAMYISSDYGYCKPDPRFFEILLDREGLDRDRTVMIGNEPQSDLAVAEAVGVDGILFDGTVSAAHTRSQYRALLEEA
ncbi:MAG: HAD family hydrolase [Butyrivibrio sp.]|nr:HAD family hydrolase [Butyrivibrio sp.]